MYILDEMKNPVRENDAVKWSAFYRSDANRRVGYTKIGDVRVSTVFLAMDHSFEGGAPILFETMVFGGEFDQSQYRYRTWDEAVNGHAAVCNMVANPISSN